MSGLRQRLARAARLPGLLRRSRSGVAAIEFAIIAPLYILLMAGMLNLGGAIYVKMTVDSAITSASTYALAKGDSITAAGAATLADQIAGMLATELGLTDSTISVDVNNGAVLSISGGVKRTNGTAANADLCYCPAANGAVVVWGSAVACASQCPSGGFAGKFVTVAASRPFTPMFPVNYIVSASSFAGSALTQAQ